MRSRIRGLHLLAEVGLEVGGGRSEKRDRVGTGWQGYGAPGIGMGHPLVLPLPPPPLPARSSLPAAPLVRLWGAIGVDKLLALLETSTHTQFEQGE